MAFRIIKEISCDCCNEVFTNEHEYRMHAQKTGGYALHILQSRINSAETEKEKIQELCDWFFDSNPTHLEFNENLIDCVIRGMRTNHIEVDCGGDAPESEWYGSDFELANYIENNKETMKKEFNSRINEYLTELDSEYNRKRNVFEKKLV